MNQTHLVKKFWRGLSIALLLLPFNPLSAGQYDVNQPSSNSKVQVEVNQIGMRPCSISQYALCSIDLVWPDPTFGRLTITNTSGNTLTNIDFTIENSAISLFLSIEKDLPCDSLSPGAQCVISIILMDNPPSPASEIVNITGSGMVLGQFRISVSPTF